MKKLLLAACLFAGLAITACNGHDPHAVAADSQMMMGKSNQLGTANDTSHTAAAADSQAVGKKDGAPTDTVTDPTASGKINK